MVEARDEAGAEVGDLADLVEVIGGDAAEEGAPAHRVGHRIAFVFRRPRRTSPPGAQLQ